jgi:hypothetical protein
MRDKLGERIGYKLTHWIRDELGESMGSRLGS